MPEQTSRASDRPLRDLFEFGAVGGLGDGPLLELFLGGDGAKASAAFDALIRRHGPMIQAACRAILRDRHEAEDAAQTVFLILARNARSIRLPEALASWLLGVARRVALRLKSRQHRRDEVGREVALRSNPCGPPAEDAIARVEALRQEIARLPTRLQAPIVLCALGGLSYDDAARILGASPGSIRGRLARARQRLRDRLVRHGVDPDEAWGALALPSRRAAMPEGLSAARRAAILEAARRVTGVGSGWVLTSFLNRGEVSAMQVNVIKAAVVVFAAAGGLIIAQPAGRPGTVVLGAAPQSPSPRLDPARPSPGLDQLRGTWIRTSTHAGGITQLVDAIDPSRQLELEISEEGFRFGRGNAPELAKLDPDRTPKEIDLTPTGGQAGPLQGKPYYGIYEVAGDTLMLCLDIVPQSERPREFSARPGERQLIDIYRRAKP